MLICHVYLATGKKLSYPFYFPQKFQDTKHFESETFRVLPIVSHTARPSGSGPVREHGTKELPSMCARVFTLRAHSGCALNLLILFERVDKTAVELFIVRGTSEDRVLTSLRTNNRGTEIIKSCAFRSFIWTFLARDPSPRRILSLTSHTFFSLSLVLLFYDLAYVPITAYFRAFKKQDRDSLIWQSDCLQIIKLVKTKKNWTDWFPRIMKSTIKQWVHRGRSPQAISRVLDTRKTWFNEHYVVMCRYGFVQYLKSKKEEEKRNIHLW